MFSIRRKAGMMSTPAVIKSIQSITSSGYQNGLIQIRSVERSLAHNGRTYRRCCRLRPSWNSTNLHFPYLVAQWYQLDSVCLTWTRPTQTTSILRDRRSDRDVCHSRTGPDWQNVCEYGMEGRILSFWDVVYTPPPSCGRSSL
jgi:hypothetical protein